MRAAVARQGESRTANAAQNPPSLENWVRVSDGVYEGELHGVSGMADGSVRVTVSQREAAWKPEGGTGGPPNLVESEEWCVVTATGDVFQLGLPQLQTWDGTTPSAAVQLQTKEAATGLLALASRLPSSALTLVGGTVVLGATANLALAAFGHHVDVSVFIV
jgi:hypothetical protein